MFSKTFQLNLQVFVLILLQSLEQILSDQSFGANKSSRANLEEIMQTGTHKLIS